MKKVSLVKIIFLCLAILIIDILAFYWLKSITQLVAADWFRYTVHALFWLFTVGLITAILLLKIRLDRVHPKRRQAIISRFYGLGILSFAPKLIFVIVISILYFTNFLFSETQSVLIISIVGLLSGFLPFFVILNGIVRSVYRFKVYREKVQFDLLPKAFDGMKVVQISDLHLGSFDYKYKKLKPAIEIINKLEPDFIFMTGDLVNNYAIELKGWDKIFKQLKAKEGKYAILGNHDYGDYSNWTSPKAKRQNFELIQHFFKKIDFKLLNNEAEIIRKDEAEIVIVGVENWGLPPFKQYGDLQKALKNVNEIPFKLLLSHDPMHWTEEVIEKTDISLMLAGHTHGMQAGISVKNKQWSPIKYKFKHWAGLYEENGQYLYVNRGLGWLGFPARIGMRPEITLIEMESNV
ncbi:metallophosphoesterase [Brumimicrobium salinarum]|uniref:Metallophosphoesterase n=1 Tax=Brumimicrobium salinarum TaxID=2058658 RepID=A0A2I0R6J9_9FLAO|nr:metallophosphoesterase [Brumimicrobium salinarum]PKR82212.1 metallophosphoesterase [Brumimicrobium salinarum]